MPKRSGRLNKRARPRIQKTSLGWFSETRLDSIQTIQPTHTKPANDRENKVRTAKLQPVFAVAVCAADFDEKNARKMVCQISPEKHFRHGRLLATSGRRLRFLRPMVRAGQARRLLAESPVPGAVRGDGPFIR